MMHKRNPFQNHNFSEYEDDEIKEQDWDLDMDTDTTALKNFGTFDTKNFNFQMDAVSQNIVISSSGLNLVKSFFKYVELLNVWPPYSFEILLGITQLFEFYVFAVFFLYSGEENQKKLFDDTFHSKINEFSNESSGSKSFQNKLSQLHELNLFQIKFSTLKTELIRIKDWLESQVSSICQEYDLSGRKLLEKLWNNNSIFDTMDTKQNYEIFSESIVAVESVFFIYECLYKLKEKIMVSINIEHKSYVVQFYNQSEKLIKELRQFIYQENWKKIMKFDPIVELVKSTDWNISTYTMMDSPYIGRLLHQVSQCEEKIKSYGGGSIPNYVLHKILYHLIYMMSKSILKGFSLVK